MDVNMDVVTNKFTGRQKLEYTNNSPDTLHKLFYHLYWNAFQPGSMMDNKSLFLGNVKLNGQPDWDQRVKDRISKLTRRRNRVSEDCFVNNEWCCRRSSPFMKRLWK